MNEKIEYLKETYYCDKCKRFHKYLYQGKISLTHKKHFEYIYKYKSNMSQTELFKLSFKESWKREGKRISNLPKKELFINQ